MAPTEDDTSEMSTVRQVRPMVFESDERIDQQGAAWWSRLDSLRRPLFVLAEAVFSLLVWQVAVGQLELLNPVFLPAPLTILRALYDLLAGDKLWPHLEFSAVNWVIGYSLASVIGIVVGLLMGTFVPIGRLVGPLAWSLYATPLVAIRPMTVVWFGFGAPPIIFLIFVSALFAVLLNTAAGVRTVDPSLLRAGRVFGAGRLDLYTKIVLPSTLPYIVTGMRLAIPASLIGMLVGELVGSPLGLGAVVMLGTSTFHTDQALAAIIILVVASVFLVRLVGDVERRLAPWRKEVDLGG